MNAPAWSKQVRDRAKTEGKYLVKLVVDGRPLKRSAGAVSCDVGPKTAARVKKLFEDLCDDKKRGK